MTEVAERPTRQAKNGPPKKVAAKQVEVMAPNYQQAVIPVVGLTPLLCHNMTQEAKLSIVLDRQQKEEGATKGKKKKAAKSIEEQFADSCYIIDPDAEEHDGKYGFPTSGFRLACVQAARTTDMPMTQARLAFLPLVEMVPIKFSEVRIRIDKVGGTTPGKPSTACVRAEFHDWSLDLPVEFDADNTSLEVIVNLLQRAGRCIGVGAWRPACGGLHGRFRVGE